MSFNTFSNHCFNNHSYNQLIFLNYEKIINKKIIIIIFLRNKQIFMV